MSEINNTQFMACNKPYNVREIETLSIDQINDIEDNCMLSEDKAEEIANKSVAVITDSDFGNQYVHMIKQVDYTVLEGFENLKFKIKYSNIISNDLNYRFAVDDTGNITQFGEHVISFVNGKNTDVFRAAVADIEALIYDLKFLIEDNKNTEKKTKDAIDATKRTNLKNFVKHSIEGSKFVQTETDENIKNGMNTLEERTKEFDILWNIALEKSIVTKYTSAADIAEKARIARIARTEQNPVKEQNTENTENNTEFIPLGQDDHTTQETEHKAAAQGEELTTTEVNKEDDHTTQETEPKVAAQGEEPTTTEVNEDQNSEVVKNPYKNMTAQEKKDHLSDLKGQFSAVYTAVYRFVYNSKEISYDETVANLFTVTGCQPKDVIKLYKDVSEVLDEEVNNENICKDLGVVPADTGTCKSALDGNMNLIKDFISSIPESDKQ